MIAVSGLITTKLNLILTILITVASAVVSNIPLILIELFLISNYQILKLLGVILFISGFLISIYISIVSAALMGQEKSNEWTYSYFSSYFIGFTFI